MVHYRKTKPINEEVPAPKKNLLKKCNNCPFETTNYREFKAHIKDCNKDRMTVGDAMKEGS